jgi:hypothetical protein
MVNLTRPGGRLVVAGHDHLEGGDGFGAAFAVGMNEQRGWREGEVGGDGEGFREGELQELVGDLLEVTSRRPKRDDWRNAKSSFPVDSVPVFDVLEWV